VLPLGAFMDQNVIFRVDATATQLSQGRNSLFKQLCGSLGGTRKLRDLFVVGGDYDSSVLTRWDQTAARGSVIVEWFDMPNSGVAAAAGDFCLLPGGGCRTGHWLSNAAVTGKKRPARVLP
jgi:hypothetical protein